MVAAFDATDDHVVQKIWDVEAGGTRHVSFLAINACPRGNPFHRSINLNNFKLAVMGDGGRKVFAFVR
ncbi:hypothetical protein JCM30471_28930 [Desulfuromonas carbonis]